MVRSDPSRLGGAIPRRIYGRRAINPLGVSRHAVFPPPPPSVSGGACEPALINSLSFLPAARRIYLRGINDGVTNPPPLPIPIPFPPARPRPSS